MKKLGLILFGFSLLALPSLSFAAGSSAFSVNPATVSKNPGQAFSLEAKANVTGDSATAFHLVVTYNAAVLQLQNWSNSTACGMQFASTNAAGSLTLDLGCTSPVSGSAVITTLNFLAKANGSTTVGYGNTTKAVNTKGDDLGKSYASASITVSTAAVVTPTPPTPATISQPSPSSSSTTSSSGGYSQSTAADDTGGSSTTTGGEAAASSDTAASADSAAAADTTTSEATASDSNSDTQAPTSTTNKVLPWVGGSLLLLLIIGITVGIIFFKKKKKASVMPVSGPPTSPAPQVSTPVNPQTSPIMANPVVPPTTPAPQPPNQNIGNPPVPPMPGNLPPQPPV